MTRSPPDQPPALPATSLTDALHGGRIPGLDFMRAVAVLLVLAYHAGILPSHWPDLNIGGTGVEIFFVLSGFLITWLLLTEIDASGRISLRAFYQRRFARLMPIFYAYVLAGMAALALQHKPMPWGAIGASVAYVLNYYQGLTGAPTHYLSHCWSLAVEEQFYVLWPFLLLLLVRQSWRLDKSIALMIVCIGLYRAALHWSGMASDAYLYRGLDTRGDHLLFGCLLAVVLRQASARAWFERLAERGPWLALLLATLLCASSAFNVNLDYRYTVGYVINPSLIAVLLPLVIIMAQQNRLAVARLINASAVIKMGQASYGIYLFHPLFFHPVRHKIEALSGSVALGFVGGTLALSVLAYLSYTYIESPLRQRLSYKG